MWGAGRSARRSACRTWSRWVCCSPRRLTRPGAPLPPAFAPRMAGLRVSEPGRVDWPGPSDQFVERISATMQVFAYILVVLLILTSVLLTLLILLHRGKGGGLS